MSKDQICSGKLWVKRLEAFNKVIVCYLLTLSPRERIDAWSYLHQFTSGLIPISSLDYLLKLLKERVKHKRNLQEREISHKKRWHDNG